MPNPHPTAARLDPTLAAGPDDEICEIVITAPDPDWLADFTRSLVEDRLVAGAHIIDHIRSIHRWHGEVRDVPEARATLRTRNAHFATILSRALKEHPYEVPSVVAVPISATNPAYCEWILGQTELSTTLDTMTQEMKTTKPTPTGHLTTPTGDQG